MDIGFAARVFFRWAHILAAVVAVGGIVFLRFILLPAARRVLDPREFDRLREATVARWRVAAFACIGVLLVSGTFNFLAVCGPKGRASAVYHPLFGIKVVLAGAVFVIASGLVGRHQAFEPMRRKSGRWLLINVILATTVILISGLLRNLPAP